jgi:hypothetical protein
MTAIHLAESSLPVSEGTQNPQLQTRRNTAKIVVGLTVVFPISYVPYHVVCNYIIIIIIINANQKVYHFNWMMFNN